MRAEKEKGIRVLSFFSVIERMEAQYMTPFEKAN